MLTYAVCSTWGALKNPAAPLRPGTLTASPETSGNKDRGPITPWVCRPVAGGSLEPGREDSGQSPTPGYCVGFSGRWQTLGLSMDPTEVHVQRRLLSGTDQAQMLDDSSTIYVTLFFNE